jgi:hypothetical protein
MSNTNFNKRIKNLSTLDDVYKIHPAYKTAKELYLKGVIRSLPSLKKNLKTIKIKKDGTPYKSSLNKLEKIEKLKTTTYKKETLKALITKTQERKQQRKLKQNIQRELKEQSAFIKNSISNDVVLDENNIYNFQPWIHTNEVKQAMRTSQLGYISHQIKFYEGNTEIKDMRQVFNFPNTMTRKDIHEKFRYLVSGGTDGSSWIVFRFILHPTIRNRKVILRTITAPKLENQNKQSRFLQLFRNNDSGDCVYRGLVQFFEKYQNDEKSTQGRAIYRKLIKQESKFKRAYTVEDMQEMAGLLNISITIKDIINNGKNDILINKNSFNYYNVEFLNTKYNHLDLKICHSNNAEEVSQEEYNNLKKTSPFYVEKFNTLTTTDKTYKIKDNEFKKLFNEWKNENNINTLKIPVSSDAYNFINKYDDKIHRMFDNKMEINDNLYNEIDMNKAFFNFNKCDEYSGLPSGSFICVNGAGFTVDLFNKQFNNGLVGFYEIKILNVTEQKKDIFKMLGLNIKSSHILFSSMIKLIINYAELEFINYCISPAIDIKFNNEFLKTVINGKLYTAEEIEADETLKNAKKVKAYSKVVGIMGIDTFTTTTNIKALDQDKDFYKTLDSDYIYQFEDIFKIVEPIDATSLKHVAYSIKANVQTIILKQLLQMKSSDIFGVKVDSIVYKKQADFKIVDTYKELFKEPVKSNIENMLKSDYNTMLKNEKSKFYINYFKTMVMGQLLEKKDDSIYIKLAKHKIENMLKNKYSSPYYIKYFIQMEKKQDSENFDLSPLPNGEHIIQKIIYCGGGGGCGKSYSILNSRIFMKNKILYSSNCWELIQAKADEFKEFGVVGLSLPKLTGEMNGAKVEQYNTGYAKYKALDELTLNNKKTVETVINQDAGRCFIFLIGDVDEDGFYYQASISKDIFNPSNYKNIQYVKYLKTYRFDNELNEKLQAIRKFMRTGKNNPYLLYNEVKQHFKDNFYNKDEIIFNKNDVGISALQPINKLGDCIYSEPFFNNGSIKQYYRKETNFKKKIYKGGKLEEQIEGKNCVCSLFRTIHSYQGRQLDTGDGRIIILLNSLFDYNLLYTALSRARRVNQIVIINDLNERDKLLLNRF